MKKQAFLALILVAIAAHADNALNIKQAWIRYIPGDRPMAGYLVAENTSALDQTVTGASSAAFESVELHRSMEKDGMASMQPVTSIGLPAHGIVALAPGGYHLMLVNRQTALKVGDEIPVTLKFNNGTEQTTIFTIKPTWQE